MTRTTPIAPFNAQISLSINVIDSDGVVATNPVSFNNIAFNTGSEQRYGRIAFRNVVGSELLNLPVPMRAEYFSSTSAGFVLSAADNCTTGVALSLSNFGGNLGAGETCVIDNGAPGASGAGCAAPGIIGQRFSAPPTAGDFIAILRAPNAGNDGTLTINATVPAWLRFDWNQLWIV
jgi:MSHA biogenesis protein MshQ